MTTLVIATIEATGATLAFTAGACLIFAVLSGVFVYSDPSNEPVAKDSPAIPVFSMFGFSLAAIFFLAAAIIVAFGIVAVPLVGGMLLAGAFLFYRFL